MQEVLITCQAHHLHPLMNALDREFGILSMLKHWGLSTKQEQGYLLLEWEGEIDPAFAAHLHAEARALDVYVTHFDESIYERLPVLEGSVSR
jgi:hypothetical protein